MARKKSEGREIVTLADLAPRHEVTGGSRRVFGADAPLRSRKTGQEDTMAATRKTKDLAPKAPSKVKGGKLSANSSLTLVRVARPGVTKDLSPSQNPKGGKKQS
jgi:hypothetical protein